MIIDAHTHIYSRLCGLTGMGTTQSLSYGKARLGLEQVLRFLPPLAAETRFPPEVLLEYMDWVGVDRAVLLQGPLYGDMNVEVSDAVRRWPDRFIGAALFDPLLVSARARFEELVDWAGLRVVKLELSEGTGLCGVNPGWNLADDRLIWLWEEAECRGLTITLDLGTIGTRSYQTHQLGELVKTYPDVRWVIAHLGQPSPRVWAEPEVRAAWTEQVGLAQHANVWLDIASLPHYFRDEDYPYPSAGWALCQAVELVGVKKLLWGTDIPSMLTMLTYQQLRDLYFRHCDYLRAGDKDLIFGMNALDAYA